MLNLLFLECLIGGKDVLSSEKYKYIHNIQNINLYINLFINRMMDSKYFKRLFYLIIDNKSQNELQFK